jgi:hypothetical protein
VQDVQLPAYYKHLREGTSRPPPPDVRGAEDAEDSQSGRASADVAGYAQVYGPRNAPGGYYHASGEPDSDHYSDGAHALGSRGGLGSQRAAAQGEFAQSLATSEQCHLSSEACRASDLWLPLHLHRCTTLMRNLWRAVEPWRGLELCSF